jgi:hypothetical protein
MPTNSTARAMDIILCGAALVDVFIPVKSFPTEDGKYGTSRPPVIRVGGNCYISAQVLGQMVRHTKQSASTHRSQVEGKTDGAVDRVPRIALMTTFAGPDASR